jgi:hypothetical protein
MLFIDIKNRRWQLRDTSAAKKSRNANGTFRLKHGATPDEVFVPE